MEDIKTVYNELSKFAYDKLKRDVPTEEEDKVFEKVARWHKLDDILYPLFDNEDDSKSAEIDKLDEDMRYVCLLIQNGNLTKEKFIEDMLDAYEENYGSCSGCIETVQDAFYQLCDKYKNSLNTKL